MELFLASLPGSSGTSSSLQKVAASSAPVLILGEPGTGRSAFARLVHKASPRASSPLVELDPAALPAALLALAWAGLWSRETGAVLALAGALLQITGWGIAAGRRSDGSWRSAVVLGAGQGMLGVVLLGLEMLVL